jgi:hypothetical protein
MFIALAILIYLPNRILFTSKIEERENESKGDELGSRLFIAWVACGAIRKLNRSVRPNSLLDSCAVVVEILRLEIILYVIEL